MKDWGKRRWWRNIEDKSLVQETIQTIKPNVEVKTVPTVAASSSYTAKRGRFLLLLTMVLFSFCAFKLFQIQVIQGPKYAQAALNARTSPTTVPAKRGDILDRNGNVLATSVEVYDVSVNQKLIKKYQHKEVLDPDGNIVADENKYSDPRNRLGVVGTGAEAAALQLAPILEQDPTVLGGKMVGDSGFKYLAKGVKPEVWRKIKALKIEGINGDRRYVREYPNGATGSSILGFTDVDGKGQAGIEKTQDKILTGVAGKRVVEISPSGQVIPGGKDETVGAKDGSNVKLTIDYDLQAFAEKAINEKVAEADASWGSVIVQETQSGKILALADSGNLYPDEMRTAKSGTSGSRSIQYTYEPGSTGKLVTFAEALEKKKITPLSPFTVPYTITLNNETFKDSHEHPVQYLTAAGVLAESSNTGTVQIGQRVDDKDRYNMMLKLGLGKRTGIEMPGESRGIIAKYNRWDRRQRLTTMFGQGMATTPLQVVNMMNTIGNRGIFVQPHLVEGYVSSQGAVTVKKNNAPKQVINQDVAATLVRMMESVTTDEGTARRGRVNGYRTAGKTGTTQLIAANGVSKGVVASFVGVAPAENPQVTVSVVVYQPRRGVYGGTVAAPVFSQVMSQAMTLLDVPPSTEPQKLYPQQG